MLDIMGNECVDRKNDWYSEMSLWVTDISQWIGGIVNFDFYCLLIESD